MKRLFISMCALVMLTVVAGCTSKGEEAVEATTTAFNTLADRLAQIQTRDQIAAAEPDLKKIGEKIKAAMEQMKILDQLPDAENKAIGEKLGRQMVSARQRAFAEVKRIANTIDPLAGERITGMIGVK